MFEVIAGILGWVALGSLLTAYLLITFKGVNAVSFLYQSVYFLGSFGFFISAVATKNWPIAIFNLFMAVLAGTKSIQAFLKRKNRGK